ncbi:hypothetical protein WA158_000894 [Blastocystis sp. Blastoise]
MTVSSIYIMDHKGKIIISRAYRGDVDDSVPERFAELIRDKEDSDLKPVITEGGITYIYVKSGGLFLMAVTSRNANVTMIMLFLHKVVQVFNDYFDEFNEENIRDNFVVLYELFDEMMDFGYPQTTDPKVLKEYIMQESNRMEKKVFIPASVTNAISWRQEGIKYNKNEVFLDVIEKLNLMVGRDGTVLDSEIVGTIHMKCCLSGMPELKLGLNDKVRFDMGEGAQRHKIGGSGNNNIDLEDVRFHQCVKLATFENDRTISFTPPDGEFELMTYRLHTEVKPLIHVEVSVTKKSSHIDYFVKAKSNFKARSTAQDVEIFIPVPNDVDTPQFNTSLGTVTYVPDKDCLLWRIKQFYGMREFHMRAHFGLPTVSRDDGVQDDYQSRPIQVLFEIPYYTVSGIQVRYLKIVEKSGYEALPWVRYITRNGDYQLRMK